MKQRVMESYAQIDSAIALSVCFHVLNLEDLGQSDYSVSRRDSLRLHSQPLGKIRLQRARLQARAAQSDVSVGPQEVEGATRDAAARQFFFVGGVVGDRVDAQECVRER